ncbi:hypothetical protein [Pseudomonas syringae]|uniref:hypothetical protein n=1 Tax=Pseudomonas syringae TaxID=317 RepID=UPI001058630E|nr:hypothetical protein [Pseudomonas syringae]
MPLMSRECTTDFSALRSYVAAYSVTPNLAKNSYVESMKAMHKAYFSVVCWHAEVISSKDDIFASRSSFIDDVWLRISEAVSDLSSSLFNWINGSYKACRIMLRSSIENFVRAIAAIEQPGILKEKNVYKLFELSAKLQVFTAHSTIKCYFDQLHSDYKILCRDTHTASFENMEQITSLDGLPVYAKAKAVSAKDLYVRVSQGFTVMVCLLLNAEFHKMHHRNRENILNAVPKSIRPLIADFNF